MNGKVQAIELDYEKLRLQKENVEEKLKEAKMGLMNKDQEW